MAEARPSSGQSSSQQASSTQASSTQSQQASVPAQHGSPETEAMARTPDQRAEVEREVTPEVRGPLAGDPLALGLPAFIVGSVALGLVLVGFVSPLGTGASLPIILLATAIGLLISTLWAMAVGQSAVAMILGVFTGFWASYGFLVLGLQHGWFGITLVDLRSSQELFLIAWIVIMSMLTLATLRLAMAFTAVLLLVDVALICVLVGVINTSANWLKAGGAIAFLFATIGVFIFFGTASVATGGKPIPLGRPIMPAGSARSRTLGVSLTVSCRSFTASETPAAPGAAKVVLSHARGAPTSPPVSRCPTDMNRERPHCSAHPITRPTVARSAPARAAVPATRAMTHAAGGKLPGCGATIPGGSCYGSTAPGSSALTGCARPGTTAC